MSNQLTDEELTFGDESPAPVIMAGLTPLDHTARRCKPWLLSLAGRRRPGMFNESPPGMFNECSKAIKVGLCSYLRCQPSHGKAGISSVPLISCKSLIRSIP